MGEDVTVYNNGRNDVQFTRQRRVNKTLMSISIRIDGSVNAKHPAAVSQLLASRGTGFLSTITMAV